MDFAQGCIFVRIKFLVGASDGGKRKKAYTGNLARSFLPRKKYIEKKKKK